MSQSGWNRHKEEPKVEAKKSPTAFRGAVAGLVVVALAGCIAWLLLAPNGDRAPAPVTETQPKKIKEQKPVVIQKVEVAKEEPKPEPEEEKDPRWKVVKIVSCRTNEMGMVVTRKLMADGHYHTSQSIPKPLYNNVADQVLSMVLNTPEGSDIPPIPPIPDIDKIFRKALERPIKIDDDDPEDIKAMKMTVQESREQMRALLDEGRTFSEIISEHRELVNANNKIRNDAMRELQEIVDSGDAEGARAYQIKISAALGQMGIKDLDMPEPTAERIAARNERMRIKHMEQKK